MFGESRADCYTNEKVIQIVLMEVNVTNASSIIDMRHGFTNGYSVVTMSSGAPLGDVVVIQRGEHLRDGCPVWSRRHRDTVGWVKEKPCVVQSLL